MMTRPPTRSAKPILRPRGFDDLGLKRALSDRLLPMLVGAMAFLAALALAGAIGASALAQHWREGAAAVLTVQVPRPTERALEKSTEPGNRLDRVLTILRGTPGIQSARTLDEAELAELLKPWLGSGAGRIAVPLPAVIEVRLAEQGAADLVALGARVAAVAPGTLLESQDEWVRQLGALARSLQACGALALGVVAFVAVAVIAVATRAGLSTRRDAIEIVHGLGATDGYVASRFARRATLLASFGAAAGALVALPVLLGLVTLAAPFGRSNGEDLVAGLPLTLWLALPALPALAAAIGWVTAQGTVRRWLRRLP